MSPISAPIIQSKTVVLPEREVMLKRLKKIKSIDKYIEEKLFPNFLDQAGREKTSDAVVVMLNSAIYDFKKNLPKSGKMVYSVHFASEKPQYLDALIEDQDALKEAQEILKKP